MVVSCGWRLTIHAWTLASNSRHLIEPGSSGNGTVAVVHSALGPACVVRIIMQSAKQSLAPWFCLIQSLDFHHEHSTNCHSNHIPPGSAGHFGRLDGSTHCVPWQYSRLANRRLEPRVVPARADRRLACHGVLARHERLSENVAQSDGFGARYSLSGGAGRWRHLSRHLNLDRRSSAKAGTQRPCFQQLEVTGSPLLRG